MLLRMELREPGMYNSIMEAIARGCNKITEIADCIHEDRGKCSKHLMFISKSGYTSSVRRRAKAEGAVLLTIDDLF